MSLQVNVKTINLWVRFQWIRLWTPGRLRVYYPTNTARVLVGWSATPSIGYSAKNRLGINWWRVAVQNECFANGRRRKIGANPSVTAAAAATPTTSERLTNVSKPVAETCPMKVYISEKKNEYWTEFFSSKKNAETRKILSMEKCLKSKRNITRCRYCNE